MKIYLYLFTTHIHTNTYAYFATYLSFWILPENFVVTITQIQQCRVYDQVCCTIKKELEGGFETSGRNVKNKSNDISFQTGQSSTNIEAALGKIEETEPNPIGSSVQSIIYLKYFLRITFLFQFIRTYKINKISRINKEYYT